MNPPTEIPILDLRPQYLSLKDEIQIAITQVLESGEFIMGSDVRLFEQEAAAYLGTKHAISVNSGTDALVIGLRALGISEGDEVITTPFSFFATAESISNVGAKPIFADVDISSFNIDPAAIEKQITPKTKAIMPVHLYGNPAAMAQIMKIADRYGLKVIEDCAQAFGARYQGDYSTNQGKSCKAAERNGFADKHVGTIGHVGAYSFFPSKNLGAYGDGGLLTTNDEQVAEIARMLRVHGAKKKYQNEILGYNSRLDTLQAAILRVKLPYIDAWNQARYKVGQAYNELLKGVPELITPQLTRGQVFHQYTVRIKNNKRDLVERYLKEQGIGTMIYYPVPQNQLPIYRDQNCTCSVAQLLSQQVLSLPIWPEIEMRVIEQVAKAVRQALSEP